MHVRYNRNICLEIYVGEEAEFQTELADPTFIFNPFIKQHHVKSIGSCELPKEVEHALDEIAFKFSVICPDKTLDADTRMIQDYYADRSKADLLNEVVSGSEIKLCIEKHVRENWLEQIYECIPLSQRQKLGYSYAFVKVGVTTKKFQFISRSQVCFFKRAGELDVETDMSRTLFVPMSFSIREISEEL